jgi:hypothetical protein
MENYKDKFITAIENKIDLKLWRITWHDDDLAEMNDENSSHLHIAAENMAGVINVIEKQFDVTAIIDIRDIKLVGSVCSDYFPKKE